MGVKIKKKAGETSSSGPTFIAKVIKDDTYLVMAASKYYPEDEFVGLYFSQTDTSKVFLQPPYEPKRLMYLTTQNNVLLQCIDAMEVNVDGTGYELVGAVQGQEPDQAEVNRLKGFLDEPFPNTSLTTIRRAMRRDLESCGYAFIEVLRNLDNEVVGLRNIVSHTVRFVRYDKPTQVTRMVTRNGVQVQLTYWERERRFAQKIGPHHYLYFREFGTSRHIDRNKGEWETEEKPVAPENRGTELLMFRLVPDVDTPYGVPRWINNLPSVLGSRKAEEQNLEYFDAGCMPPAIIFIQGGTLAKDMADSLRTYLSGQLKSRHRAVVVEAQPSAGSIESTGKVEVRVERFGSESMKDGLFQAYDASSEEHVRVSFRLPPLFIGKAQDYNFATAQTGYMVAEAQVFQPDRTLFDEVFNNTVMKALGAKTCKLKSKPITLKDVASVIQALNLGPVSQFVERDSYIKEVNNSTGMDLVVKAEEAPLQPGQGLPFGQAPFGAPQLGPGGTPVNTPQAAGEIPKALGSGQDSGDEQQEENKPGEGSSAGPTKEGPEDESRSKSQVQKILKLARDFCAAEGLLPTKFDVPPSEKVKIRKSVDELGQHDREFLNRIVGIHVKAMVDSDEVPAFMHKH